MPLEVYVLNLQYCLQEARRSPDLAVRCQWLQIADDWTFLIEAARSEAARAEDRFSPVVEFPVVGLPGDSLKER